MKKYLDSVNKQIKHVLQSSSPVFKKLYNDANLYNGKMLRAKLLFTFSGRINAKVFKAAAAIELLHMAALVHDDILDDATMRRGKQPLYLKWSTPISLLYGDYLFSSSFAMINDLDNLVFREEIINAARKMLDGEIHQQSRKGAAPLSRQEYFSIIEKKTGSLFGTACKLGAMLKGGNSRSWQKAYKFGCCVGIAYQIFDDCVDYDGPQDGKQKFSDIKKGIATLPVIYLMKSCDKKEKEYIKNLFNKQKAAKKDINKIVRLMKKYNSIKRSLEDATCFLKQADIAREQK